MKNSMKLLPLGLLFLAASSYAQFGRSDDFDNKVIYGVDSRLEYFQAEPVIRTLADSVVSLWSSTDLEALPEGGFRLKTVKFGETDINGAKVCEGEPYRDQPVGPGCSGALVGEDLVLTAGHCVARQAHCDKIKIVFGFNVSVIGGEAPATMPASNVYSCKSIVKSAFESSGASETTDRDFAIIRLDRKVAGRAPLRLNRDGGLAKGDGVFAIGHPMGLPAKIAGDAAVVKMDPAALFFEASLDTYGRNSGSPVFNTRTNLIEGVLVRGNMDFKRSPEGCMVSNVLPQNSEDGEDVTKTTAFGPLIPRIAGEAGAAVPVDSSSIKVEPLEFRGVSFN